MTSRSDDMIKELNLSQINEDKIKRFKLLQGQCKIQNIILLKLNILKTIFLTLLCIISVVGLLMLIWFRWFRVKVWFSQCQIQEATHVFITGPDSKEIEPVTHYRSNYITFEFKKLKYFMDKNVYFPVSFDYENNLKQILTHQYLSRGLNDERVAQNQKQYGLNEHAVQIPNYFSYIMHVLLEPFFLIQYLVCFAYFAQGFFTFAILNLAFSIITTSINYILQYFSFKKIKQMAQRVIDVKVLRNGQFVIVKSNMLVPGDLIDPNDEIMCDCILVKGDIYVNEVSLTGQNIPIGKYALTKIQQALENNRWLFQGSQIVQKRGATLALIVYTGYSTRRGRIIRKILTRKPKPTQIFKSALLFLIEVFIVAVIIYFSTIAFHKDKNVSNLIVGFRFIDFLGWSFPPTFPIFFNAAYSYTLVRLKHQGIVCTQPEKTVASSDLKIMCFDKTGTLTQNQVEIYKVFKFNGQRNQIDITKQLNQQQNWLIGKLFGTCHTVIKSEEKFLGDQIDIRMFLLSQSHIQSSQNPDVKYQVKCKNGSIVEILRINQFESKFQSMSVLVRDKQTNKIYNFIKGAPQKIMINSIIKINNFDQIVTSLSLGGYRTIGFGYRQVQFAELQKYLQGKRQLFDQKIQILGIAAFENKLKHDAKETIQRMIKSGIQPKIITGDNIYIALETGVRAGVISKQDKVIILEGKKQSNLPVENVKRKFKGTIITRHDNAVVEQPFQMLDGQTDVKFPIAVDNGFIKLQPPPIITSNMKLFARISPENKAIIISRIKQKINQQYYKKSFVKRYCGDFKDKVGMCGDGANDLMAIRQSDVGIGINNSDASYAAMFSISKLLDVEYIVRDSKATISNIVEMILYYQFITFLKIPTALLMLKDSAYWNDSQILFFNFTSTIIYPIFIPMSRPSNIITKTKPRGNLFGLLNHLQFWVSCLLATAGFTGGFLYFYNTNQYISNPNPIVTNGWQRQTHAATSVLLMILMPYAVYILTFYIGFPWKQPVYRNYILLFLIIINSVISIVINYVHDKLAKVLGFVIIPFGIVSVMLGISIGATILGFLYNKIITKVFNPTDDQMQQIFEREETKVLNQ